MNDWDRNNLNFLLTASKETLREWQQAADEDDLWYASELLARACAELAKREQKLADEEIVEDFSDAVAVLAKYRL